jgi:hypothetical protein
MHRLTPRVLSLIIPVLFSACGRSDTASKPNVDVKGSPAVAPNREQAVKSKAEQAVKSGAGPVEILKTPATLEQATLAIDMRTLPILPGAKAVSARVNEISYSAPGTLADAASLYQERLLALGWKKAVSTIPEGADYVFAEFDRGGFRVAVSASKMSEGGLRVSVTNHGNVDPRLLPQAPDAKAKMSQWHYVSYTTEAKPDKVIELCRNELVARGWKEYRVGLARYHVKEDRHLIGFVQNAMDLFFNIKGEKTGPTTVECMVKVRDRPERTPLHDLPPPATFVQGKQVIDFNRFPRLDKSSPGRGGSAELYYEAPASMADAVKFYRETLGKAGWKERRPLSDEDPFPRLSFVKDGFDLHVQLSKMDKGQGVRVHAENKGNVDVRQIPPLPDASDDEHVSADDVRYETDTPIPEAVEHYRKQLLPAGWKEIESKDRPDGSKSLVFLQNAISLNVEIDKESVRIRSQMFGEYISSPADEQKAVDTIDLRSFPRIKGAKASHVDSAHVAYTATGSIDDAAKFYRLELSKKGWLERFSPPKKDDSAKIRFAKERFVLEVSIAAKNKEVSVVVRNRGDLDLTKFLYPEGTKVDVALTPENVHCTIPLSADAAVAYFRAELPKFGWQEDMNPEEAKEKSARVLVFMHKAAKLTIEISAAADGNSQATLETRALGKP